MMNDQKGNEDGPVRIQSNPATFHKQCIASAWWSGLIFVIALLAAFTIWGLKGADNSFYYISAFIVSALAAINFLQAWGLQRSGMSKLSSIEMDADMIHIDDARGMADIPIAEVRKIVIGIGHIWVKKRKNLRLDRGISRLGFESRDVDLFVKAANKKIKYLRSSRREGKPCR